MQQRCEAHLASPSAAGSWLAWTLLRILRGTFGSSATWTGMSALREMDDTGERTLSRHAAP